MASLTVIQKQYKALIKSLFPSGWAWVAEAGSFFDKFIESLCIEPSRIEDRAMKFLNEMDPNRTFEMLDNWERLLGIPDECTRPGELTLLERRTRILQKLTLGGGQNAAFFVLLAKQLGYDTEVFDIINYRDFRVGISRVGEALSNSTDPDGEPNENGWAFTWTVKGPAEFVRRFRVGQGAVGERLVLFENTTLECVTRKFSPAHTTVLFAYED